MKKTLAAVAALLTISSSAFAALPPGVFTSQKPAGPASRPPVSTHRVHVSSYQPMDTITNRVHVTSYHPVNTVTNRVHVTSSQPVHAGLQHMHTPTGNRVRMTPTHGELEPVGGRMSSTARVSHHGGPASASIHVGPPPGPPAGTRYDRNYVRPSLPPHRYYHPVLPPPPRWRYAGYYGRPYGYSSVWYGYPVAYYGYPYRVFYGRYYVRPGIRISVRI